MGAPDAAERAGAAPSAVEAPAPSRWAPLLGREHHPGLAPTGASLTGTGRPFLHQATSTDWVAGEVKPSVTKERVRLAKDAVTEAPVNTEVRKERIDTGNLER